MAPSPFARERTAELERCKRAIADLSTKRAAADRVTIQYAAQLERVRRALGGDRLKALAEEGFYLRASGAVKGAGAAPIADCTTSDADQQVAFLPPF